MRAPRALSAIAGRRHKSCRRARRSGAAPRRDAPRRDGRHVARAVALDDAARRATPVDDAVDDRRAMKRLFGAKKPRAPVRTLADTAQSLDERATKIDAKIAALDRELVKHREAIKRARPGAAQDAAKRRALVVLKQKKMYEQQRDQLGGQLMNVEQVAFASENAKDTVETVRAMQSASKALKTQFKAKEFDLNAIDALNDDMADLLDLGEEIQETLGRSYHVPDGLDEDDLLEELDALELDMLEDEAELTGGVPSYLQDEPLPEAPEEEPVVLPEAGAGEEGDTNAPGAVRDAA